MDLGLRGKCAVVTGASKGIGRAIALGLADEGAHVAISARGADALREAKRALQERGVHVLAEVCDVGDPVALDGFLESAQRALGRVDILICNASALALGEGEAGWRLWHAQCDGMRSDESSASVWRSHGRDPSGCEAIAIADHEARRVIPRSMQ